MTHCSDVMYRLSMQPSCGDMFGGFDVGIGKKPMAHYSTFIYHHVNVNEIGNIHSQGELHLAQAQEGEPG